MNKFFNNIGYMIKKMSEHIDRILLFIFLEVLSTLLLSYATLKLTQSVITIIMEKVAIPIFIRQILLLILIVIIIQAIQYYLEYKNGLNKSMLRMKELSIVNSRWIYCDYQLFQNKEFQEISKEALDYVTSGTSLFEMFPDHLKIFLQDFVKISFYIVLLSVLDPIFIILIIFLLLVTMFYRMFQRKIMEETRPKMSKRTSQLRYIERLTQNFNIAKDIRLYQVRPWFNQIFDKVIRQIQIVTKKRGLVVLGGQLISGILIIILTGYGYYLLINRLANGSLTVANISFYIGALTIVAQSSSQALNSLFDLIQDSDEIKKYRRYLAFPPVFNHDSSQLLPDTIETIDFKNVSYQYPGSEQKQFDQFNLTLNKNEKIALVGLNGAGKTTLMMLLCNLIKPDSGHILINGIDNQAFNVNEYYQLFSVVFQEQFQLPISIKNSIIQNCEFDEIKFHRVLEQANLSHLVNSLDYKEDTHLVSAINPKAITLSGGQKQKLKLAQALYKDGSILILDEPTSALDPLAESEIYQQYYQYSQNKLSIFITHRLATTHFCDRILYLEDGVVIEEGSHEDLMNQKGQYYEMYKKQAYYYQKEVNHD